MPHDQRPNSYTLPGWPQSKECAEMRARPFIFRHDTLVAYREQSTDANLEIRKALPMFSVTFSDFLRTDEGLGHAGDIVEAFPCEPVQHTRHVVRAFRPDVLPQHCH